MNKIRKVNFDAVVAEYLNDLRLRNLSARTLQSYTSVIGWFRDFVAGGDDVQLYLDQVTSERAKAFIMSRLDQDEIFTGHRYHPPQRKKLSMFTIHQDVRSLKAFGTWLVNNNYPNPFQVLRSPWMGMIRV